MMIKTIYVIRHCKADGQKPDDDLTRIGDKQAETVADSLVDKSIDFIISSPYARAISTIMPLAKRLGISISVDNRLMERVLTSIDQPNWKSMLNNSFVDMDLCYEGGESSRIAQNRIVGVVQDLVDSTHQNIVLVSHGNLISLLLNYYDKQFGFNEWEALTSPDIFQLTFSNSEKLNIERIWTTKINL